MLFAPIDSVATRSPSLADDGGRAVPSPLKRFGFIAACGLSLKRLATVVFNRLEKAGLTGRHRRKINPYVVGAPVLDDRFFVGRDELIERVLTTIRSGHVLLYGEPRIGKTSILHHIRKRLGELTDSEMTFYPVFIDLQGVPGERLFTTLAEDIYTELSPHLATLPWRDRVSRGGDYAELVDDVRECVRFLSLQTSKKVKLVFLIDEADELNLYGERINFQLRSLFARSFANHLAVIAAGVEVGKQWAIEGTLWNGFFSTLEVPSIGREDATELIVKPLRPTLTIDPGVVDRIIELSGGKPFLIQKLCSALTNRAHKAHRYVILPADLEALLTESCDDSLCEALHPTLKT